MGDSAVYLANLRSKTRVPDTPRFAVGRERPAALLRDALRMPLVLVSAPAGFGKTSLAREFLASPGAAGYRHAWFSVDAVTGSTGSSKVILKAVESALAQGL